MGIGYASNEGISKSIGEYTLRVDADDYIHEKLFEVESMFLSMNKEYDAVCCDYLTVDDYENVIQRFNSTESPIACGVMYRKDRLIGVGMYDPEFKYNEDKDLRSRFLKEYQIHRIELPLYRYRQHSQNTSKFAI
jgi:glycosyltransferase involved in cell wall biosynthesis